MLKLVFSFEYKPKLVRGLETNPVLHFWTSSDIGHELVSINPAKQDHRVEIMIDASKGIEPDATLSCQVFVDTVNSNQEPSSNEAGSNWVHLRDIMSNVKTTQVKKPLVVWNARRKNVDAIKGEITLTFAKTKFVGGKSPFLKPTKFNLLLENEKFIIETLVNYLKQTNVIFQEKDATFEAVSNLHLPLWQSNTWQLPGSMFAVVRAEHSPEAWWTNMANVALRRHYQNMDPNSLHVIRTYFTKFATEEEVMTVVSKMHNVYVNNCTYLSDGIPVERKTRSIRIPLKGPVPPETEFISMEAFSNNIRARGNPEKLVPPGLDCEDTAFMMGVESMELRNRTDWTDPVLQKMHKTRQNYFYLQALKGVQGRQLSDSTEPDAAYRELGGHMDGMYISQESFMRMHGRYNSARPLYEGMDVSDIAKKSEYVELQRSIPLTRAPILTLEGTGLIDPLGDPSFAKNIDGFRYLYQNNGSAFQRIKFIAPQSRKQLNSFYRVVQEVDVLDLADEGYSSIRHVLLKKQPGDRISTGVDYLEFINEHPSVMSYAMPEMTENQVKVVKQIMKNLFPVKAFAVPANKAIDSNINAHLEKVKAAISRKNKTVNKEHYVVDFFPRYDQVTENLEKEWISMAHTKERLVKFEYFEEPVTTGVGSYLCRFTVNKEN